MIRGRKYLVVLGHDSCSGGANRVTEIRQAASCEQIGSLCELRLSTELADFAGADAAL